MMVFVIILLISTFQINVFADMNIETIQDIDISSLNAPVIKEEDLNTWSLNEFSEGKKIVFYHSKDDIYVWVYLKDSVVNNDLWLDNSYGYNYYLQDTGNLIMYISKDGQSWEFAQRNSDGFALRWATAIYSDVPIYYDDLTSLAID